MSHSRIFETVRYYAAGLVQEMEDKHVFIGAQAIAFKVIVTFVPLVVLGTGLIGQFLQREQPFQYVAKLIRDFFPDYQSDELIRFLGRLQDISGALTTIGIVGLLLAAVTLFTTLRTVFANIFHEEWHENRSIAVGYLFDFRMVLQVGVFFLLSIVITLVLQTMDSSGLSFLQEMGVDPEWVRRGWRGAFTSTGVILPFLLSTAVFFQLFYLVPIPRSKVRSALIGAVITALMWEFGKIGFTQYATGTGGFERGWLTPLGDTFLLIFATIFWAYYSGIVLNIGAVITVLHERRYRQLISSREDNAFKSTAIESSRKNAG